MRENCTYGSMRGRAFPTGRPALLYTLGVHIPLPSAERSDFATSAEEKSSASTARHIQLVHLEGLEPPRFRSGT